MAAKEGMNIPKDVLDSLPFDPVALKQKYLEERDKRLRKDGNNQYIMIEGQYGNYLEDPYTPVVPREPQVNVYNEIVLLGGGFASLMLAWNLREMGYKDIRVIENGGGFGGTWYWNRYPGAACDTESYIYLPLLEKTGFIPREKYTKAAEILEYCSMLAKKTDLYKDALLSTQVTKISLDEPSGLWIIETSRGDRIKAKFVVASAGGLNRAKLGGFPGILDYKGMAFHTSRWNYEYTGGSPLGNLDKLHDKTVAIIGTGATAIQCVPHLGAAAKQLYVFSRTPSSVDTRDNRPTDVEWFKSLKPGWQALRQENFSLLTLGGVAEEDLVGDKWTSTLQFILSLKKKYAGKGMKNADLLQIADFQKMESIRQRVRDIVKDPNTAKALSPMYNQYCKRPTFSDDYLETFNRPNVTLVDTDGAGVERITEKGVVANGKEYEVDCIIYGTGFEVGSSYTHRAGYELYGRGGLSLSEKWKDGAATLHGMAVHGFPNYFFVQGMQTAFVYNNNHINRVLVEHIAYIINEATKRGVKSVEVTPEAEAAWTDTIVKTAALRESFYRECTPGYYNLEGSVSSRVARNLTYGPGAEAFFDLLAQWRKKGTMDGYKLTYPSKI